MLYSLNSTSSKRSHNNRRACCTCRAGTAFNGLSKTHIVFFVDYVTSTAKKDEAWRQAALKQLDQYRFDFAKFLNGANTNFDATGLADALQSHVAQLSSAFDSYVNKDYTTAYKSIRVAYAHMFMTGDYFSISQRDLQALILSKRLD
jgi:hypothetical protein